MDNLVKNSIWLQFEAALEMFNEAIIHCPDALWAASLWEDTEDPRYGQFWFIAYHCLSWLDLFMTSTYEEFKPPAPFVRGVLPDTPYSKTDILNYFNVCRQKSQSILQGLTDEKARQVCKFQWMELSFLELQLYNMRHLQEHSSQLRYFLGRNGIPTNDWVARIPHSGA